MKLKEDAPLIIRHSVGGAWLRCVKIHAVQSGRDPTHAHSYIETYTELSPKVRTPPLIRALCMFPATCLEKCSA